MNRDRTTNRDSRDTNRNTDNKDRDTDAQKQQGRHSRHNHSRETCESGSAKEVASEVVRKR